MSVITCDQSTELVGLTSSFFFSFLTSKRVAVDNYRDVQRLGQRTLLNVETDDPVFCSTQTVRSSPEVQTNPQSALPNFVSR